MNNPVAKRLGFLANHEDSQAKFVENMKGQRGFFPEDLAKPISRFRLQKCGMMSGGISGECAGVHNNKWHCLDATALKESPLMLRNAGFPRDCLDCWLD